MIYDICWFVFQIGTSKIFSHIILLLKILKIIVKYHSYFMLKNIEESYSGEQLSKIISDSGGSRNGTQILVVFYIKIFLFCSTIKSN